MNESNIEKYIAIGAKDRFWYEKCQQLFEELYGVERLKLVTSLFAATSINSSLKSNIRLFRKALYEIENNKPFSSYLPVMRLQLERIRNGEQIGGRKINSFARAMSGDPHAVVVDIWLLRAFEMGSLYKGRNASATNKEYTTIENYVRELSYKMGWHARQLSAVIWAGCRISKGGDRETSYENILRHQLYNMYETKI